MKTHSILIVDDEPAIRDMIRMALEIAGYQCFEAESAAQAYQTVIDKRPDLVLLDWMMPEVSGIELLRRLKREELTREVPVIMLTAKVEEHNTVQGLDSGADDYIQKPFAPRELVSRVKAVLRRSQGATSDEIIDFQGLRLDLAAHRVHIDSTLLAMGPTEFKLLKFFMTHPERAYTRSQLLDQVWGGNVYVEERTVDVHIRRLRKVLQQASQECDYGRFIQTVRGTGYRFSTTITA